MFWGLRVASRTPPLPPSFLRLSCSNMQSVILHQGQHFPNLSFFFFFNIIFPLLHFFFLSILGCQDKCSEAGAWCGGDGHGACQPWGGAAKGNVGVSVPCWWAPRVKKSSQPGDAQKLMRAWIKIAAQSAMWYYFRGVHVHGGGICCCLCINAKVSSCWLFSTSHQKSAPTPSAKGCLGEGHSQSMLGSQGHFCRFFCGRAAASCPELLEINSLKALVCSAGRASPKPGLWVPWLQHTAVLQNTAVLPWTRAACHLPRAGWGGCTCQEMLRDTSDDGETTVI